MQIFHQLPTHRLGWPMERRASFINSSKESEREREQESRRLDARVCKLPWTSLGRPQTHTSTSRATGRRALTQSAATDAETRRAPLASNAARCGRALLLVVVHQRSQTSLEAFCVFKTKPKRTLEQRAGRLFAPRDGRRRAGGRRAAAAAAAAADERSICPAPQPQPKPKPSRAHGSPRGSHWAAIGSQWSRGSWAGHRLAAAPGRRRGARRPRLQISDWLRWPCGPAATRRRPSGGACSCATSGVVGSPPARPLLAGGALSEGQPRLWLEKWTRHGRAPLEARRQPSERK